MCKHAAFPSGEVGKILQFDNHKYYNCVIQLDNGAVYRVEANWLHNQNLDHWQGWHCDAGHRRLSIDKNFNVFSAQCENDNLGNLFTEWHYPGEPTVCRRERCTGCTDDLLIKKQEMRVKD